MTNRAVVRAALLGLVIAGCKTGRNYPDPAAPRHAGTAAAATTARGDTMHVVSFNIEFSIEMARAIRVLRSHADLRNADVILLQEMDARGAKMAADSLRMHYVYYPAIYSRFARKDVGNAVLSRWPIVEDAKLILPSFSRYAKTQRVATAATIDFAGRRVRVYSTHLGTPADLSHSGRVTQLNFIMSDAARFEHVVLGGDMNSRDIGSVAREAGYLWPTDTVPRSNSYGRIDHMFLKGLRLVERRGAGTASTAPGISDHRPVWIRAVIDR